MPTADTSTTSGTTQTYITLINYNRVQRVGAQSVNVTFNVMF